MKLTEKWKSECKQVLDENCWADLEKMNIFRLWNSARICRKLLKSVTEFSNKLQADVDHDTLVSRAEEGKK